MTQVIDRPLVEAPLEIQEITVQNLRYCDEAGVEVFTLEFERFEDELVSFKIEFAAKQLRVSQRYNNNSVLNGHGCLEISHENRLTEVSVKAMALEAIERIALISRHLPWNEISLNFSSDLDARSVSDIYSEFGELDVLDEPTKLLFERPLARLATSIISARNRSHEKIVDQELKALWDKLPTGVVLFSDNPVCWRGGHLGILSDVRGTQTKRSIETRAHQGVKNVNINAENRREFRLLRADDVAVLVKDGHKNPHEIIAILASNEALNLGPEFDALR